MRRTQVAELVRHHRELAGLTVVDAAKVAGIGRSTWTEIEQAVPPMKKGATLGKVARAVDLDPKVLLAVAGLAADQVEETDLSAVIADIGARLDRLEDAQRRRNDEVEQLGQKVDRLAHRVEQQPRPSSPPASP